MTRGPLLSAISLDARTGGIAQVSRMVWRAMAGVWGDARLVRLCSDGRVRATPGDKARFAGAMAVAQLSGRARWILFTHRDLLRTQILVPRRLRRPYAVFCHGIEAWGPMTARDEEVLAHAMLRLANSNFTAQRVMERHPGIGQVVACPLTLPLTEPAEQGERSACKEAGAGEAVSIGRAAVLIVGRMLAAERYKGHDQLIDVWPRVRELVPHAQLIVVGEGDDVGRLRARATAMGNADSIRFTGFVSPAALRALYEKCAVFAMPSGGEGFGLVYLEAMAHRLPCIGSRQDAASEIIVDGETGLLVDQQDARQLADAIVRLLRDPALRTSMGTAGARRLNSCFSLDRFSSRLVGCLRDAFEARGRAAASPANVQS